MTIPALSLVERIARTRESLRAEPDRLAALTRLQTWQVERLRRTYADYFAVPRYRDALEFFAQDLYGPHDFRSRDRDLGRVMQSWHRLLPERALDAITHALELEALSQSLDLELLERLSDAPLSEVTYAHAYRTANRRRDRQRQIWLILTAGRALDELIDHAWIARMLRMARGPARLAGVAALHAFLERGYAAFARMGDADELLHVIEARETAIMRNLFAGTTDPFGTGGELARRNA